MHDSLPLREGHSRYGRAAERAVRLSAAQKGRSALRALAWRRQSQATSWHAIVRSGGNDARKELGAMIYGKRTIIGTVAAIITSLVMVACSSIHYEAAGSGSMQRPGSISPDKPAGRLAGMIVGIDPGHNGANDSHSSYINKLIWNGRERETCDTTGTQTDEGYTEAQFNFQVAMFLRADLLRDGAQVAMTRTSNNGFGPCVTRRAQILNRSHANVAIDIHADGGPPSGRGFAVLEPVSDGPNNEVIAASQDFGRDVRWAFLRYTTIPPSTYYGADGITYRNDLAGLNLTTVPKVLIECGNMRNATDAVSLVSTAFQQRIAHALEAAIIRFLDKG
jgi:N-acetylmuramoyl-L-alanine amidase